MSRCVFDQSKVLYLSDDEGGSESQPTRARILKALGTVETGGQVGEGKRKVDGR